ncbi:MAG: phosphoadenylyl-sulfate reductase [Deltaproteobacteria bacterium]|nr:phosphoadenylyl-sulfate reductase [Deltaproteobacteria bacterium]
MAIDFDVAKAAADLEKKTAPEVLEWAFAKWHPRIALASSFGAEDVAVIHMMWSVRKDAKIFTLDTGRLHQATYDVMERIRSKYDIRIEPYFPKTDAVEQMVTLKGPNSFYASIENRKECCKIRKVEPLGRALAKLDGWITGLRREQAVTRGTLPKIEIDKDHGGIVKLNPIAEWTQAQVWAYIKENSIPYNALHDRDFPSIGCEPCTRAVKPGEDVRAGRWWWELPEQKECGLHVHKS